jgi:hypothetical protein
MKNCTPRRVLCWLIAAAVSFSQQSIAEAQDMLVQSSATTGSSMEGGDGAPQQSSFFPVKTNSLPDAPVAQNQSTGQGQPVSLRDPTRINRIAILPPRLKVGTVLTPHDKWEIYYHRTFSPAAMIFPLVGSGIQMTNPKKDYPAEWKDGIGAFGRNYGNAIAQRTARATADFGTQVLLNEDPRYQRSDSTNPLLRVGDALVWTFVDKSDAGHRTVALSTFTGAAAGGFVGMAYLPDGYNDVTHAEQRMALGIEARAISNVVTEFQPVWGPWAAKLRIPKLLPAWWVPQTKR